ncbi:hypothetical protein DL769_006020 [Monosporascus sp. CRB-8-3]|nr:hypothetical protein DL769_006020 [Monosporascus sp. CRB-8-3]
MTDQVETQPMLGLASGGLVKVNGFDDRTGSQTPVSARCAYTTYKSTTPPHRRAEWLGPLISLEDLGSARPINPYGVDSLVAVDTRAWALGEVQSVIHVLDTLKNVPMIELAGTIAGKVGVLARYAP